MKMVAVLFKYDSNEGYKHNTYGCLTFALYYLAVKKHIIMKKWQIRYSICIVLPIFR